MNRSPANNNDGAVSHIVVMGVSGCGKSTLAHAIANELGWPMIEGDAYHPAGNIAKMGAGTPLNDDDRAPWLAALNLAMRQQPYAVLACSALKKPYRDTLRLELPHTVFVHAQGSFETLLARMQSRYAQGSHFMPDTLLRSQFDALEAPSAGELCCTVSVIDTTAQQLARTLNFLKTYGQHPQPCEALK